MLGTRATLAMFVGEFWLMGTAASYFVLGMALAQDIVNYRFKIMNAYEIGAIAFFGEFKKSTRATSTA